MNQIIYDQPAAEYHAAEGLNKSSIDKLLRCPLEYRLSLEQKPEEPTAAMKFGTMLHTRVLEPRKYDAGYHVMQNLATTKAGKEEKKACEEEGRICISKADEEKATAMHLNLYQHRKIASLLFELPGRPEVSIFWEMPRQQDSGETRQCKARIDRLVELPDGTFIAVDLKTTSGIPSLEGLPKHIADFGYHRQAAWYCEGLRRLDVVCREFIFVFTSTNAPHLCTAVIVEAEAEVLGLRECLYARDLLADCESSDVWPSYSETVQRVNLPQWYYFNANQRQLPDIPGLTIE